MEHVHKHSSLPKSITILAFTINLFMAIGKGFVGFLAQSSALIADAGHSLSDLFSDLITYWSIHYSQQPKDENHPYGHGRFETVGSFIIALMLVATGVGVVWHTLERIENPIIPGELALWAAGISIAMKEFLYQLTYRIGKKQNSRILIANAWHHRSDAVSSIAALIGISVALLGFPLLDPIAGFLVAGLIIKSGVDIGYSSIRELTDEVAEQEVIGTILKTLEGIEGVEHFHQVRARRMGPHLLVDLHLEVNCMMSVSAAHQVAERVRWHILETMPAVNEVLIHVDAEQDSEEGEIVLMRPQAEVEQDIRNALDAIPEITGISHIYCHFLKQKLSVQVDIMVDPEMKVQQAQKLGNRAKIILEEIQDIQLADIHLELLDFDQHFAPENAA